MQNEQTNETNKEGASTAPTVPTSDTPLNIVDEARNIRDEIVKAKEELKAENEKKEKIDSERLLSGAVGGNVKATPPKEQSPAEYAEKAIAGDL